ncbi:MAG TPA: CheR family methyltransferase [Bauldia sp.]|nr:CheR family methyltransferase [Bauldia sp.]
MTPEIQTIERFREAITRRLGLLFDDTRLGFLGEVLQRRVGIAGMSAEAYVGDLESRAGRDELGGLAEALTVGETYFFRNNDQFRAFGDVAVPQRMRANMQTRRLRILSAGCASGEEPYTLAILLRSLFSEPGWQVSIRAVDANPAALRKAVAARYSSWALRETPAEVRQAWFRSIGREAVLDETVRAMVTFEQRNLAVDDADLWPPEHYDIIFCRNVLMYFSPEQMRAAAARIARALAPGGYLFLGHAETMRGLSSAFHLRHSHDTFYYQRRTADDAGEAAEIDISSVPWSAPALAPPIVDDSWVGAIGRASDRVAALSQRMATAALAVPDPEPAPTWNLGLALDLLQRERFAEAISLLDAMPPASTRDPDVLLLRAVLLANSGQSRQAAETALRLLAIDEMNAGANYVLALSFEDGGDRGAAANHYRIAIYLDPSFAMAHLHLGILLRRDGDFFAARRSLNQALTLLEREDASRLLLFGSGFTRDALIALCQSEIRRCAAKL